MRAAIFVLALGLAAPLSGDRPASAQPTGPDLARATELYRAATQAMTEGRYDDAARDFSAAYELTSDPVLFFKIASAHEKAGDCATALTFYRRYLAEGSPEPQHVQLTNERIAACTPPPAADVPEPPPSGALQADPEPVPAPPADPANDPAAPPPLPPEVFVASWNKNVAWLFVGGVLTFATTGAVLAYSTGSSEQDLRDLYFGTHGMPPTFDDKTRERYDELQAEGRRYQALAWASFGVAAGCAIGATIFFWRASREDDVVVTPVVTPTSAGVSVRF